MQSCNRHLLGCKMILSLLSIEKRVNVTDNGNNEIRGSRVERDAGGDEKQLIKFACMALLINKLKIYLNFLTTVLIACTHTFFHF